MAYSICDLEKSEMSVFSLSQSDIQSVLDTLIDLPLSPPPSSSSSISSSFCPPHTSFCQDKTDLCDLVGNSHDNRAKQNERRYSLSDYQHSPCDFQQQQQVSSGDRPLANVPLSYLLHSEVKLTPEALPAHLQLFSGNIGVVTHVNEVCWSISIYLNEGPSPTKLCVGSNEAQHLLPVCPAEGDSVRVVKSQYAGREGRVNSCSNEREFLVELTDGSQIYVVNTDLVRLHDMRHLSVNNCINNQVTVDSAPSRPTTLTPSGDTWNIGSLQIDSPMDCYGRGGVMGYDHTPTPSPSDGSCMSPSSPWSVGYYPHTPHHHGNSRECPASPVELPPTPTCTPCTTTTYYPTPTLAPPNYNYGTTPTVPTYCGVYPRHPFYNPRMYHYGMNPFQRLRPHMMTGYIPYLQRPPPPYQHRTNTPHSTSGYCSFMHQPITTGCRQTGSSNQFSCNSQTSKSLNPCISIYQTSSTCVGESSQTKGCKINPLDELKTLICADSKQKGILSSKLCPGKSLTCEEIIAKVVDKICGIEPPKNWYNPNSKKNSCDELVTESVLVSAICPLTKQRMEYPCRGLNCTHLQCFDAKAFLQLALKRRAQSGSCKSLSSSSHPISGWKCPVCNKVVCPKQLFIEKHLKKVLESTDALELEYKDIGHWEPVERPSESTAPCVIDLTLESDDEL